jgi:hypothetical protein
MIAIIVAITGLVVGWLSYQAAARSASAAETSAVEARRSADAAESGVRLQEEALELERNRERREWRERHRDATNAEWEPAEDGEAGFFRSTSTEFVGALRNTGLTSTRIRGAYLDFDGQRALLHTRCEGPNGSGGWESSPSVPPQAVLLLRASIGPAGLRGDARPTIYMDFDAAGIDNGIEGVTIELLRAGSAPTGEALWRVGRSRMALLP